MNQRSFEESFLINSNGNLQEDLLIYGLHDRNRALHGDVVVVRIKDRENWLVSALSLIFFKCCCLHQKHLEAEDFILALCHLLLFAGR